MVSAAVSILSVTALDSASAFSSIEAVTIAVLSESESTNREEASAMPSAIEVFRPATASTSAFMSFETVETMASASPAVALIVSSAEEADEAIAAASPVEIDSATLFRLTTTSAAFLSNDAMAAASDAVFSETASTTFSAAIISKFMSFASFSILATAVASAMPSDTAASANCSISWVDFITSAAVDSRPATTFASPFATEATASATASAARMDSWTSLALAFNSSTSAAFALEESATILSTRVSALWMVFTTSSPLDFNSSIAVVSDAATVAIVSATASATLTVSVASATALSSVEAPPAADIDFTTSSTARTLLLTFSSPPEISFTANFTFS
mmetsp:Transcript_3616/g.10283  ORF Transcript_3616/g.10283 Transcript_3616/m.10283 type:complete len:334 (-) Transcript_3616:571-1572(-)